MTICNITDNGDLHKIECKGHSGTDDICNAVSTLLQSLAGWINSSDEAKLIRSEIKPGDVTIVFTGGRQALEVIEVGMLQLQALAPGQIKVSSRHSGMIYKLISLPNGEVISPLW